MNTPADTIYFLALRAIIRGPVAHPGDRGPNRKLASPMRFREFDFADEYSGTEISREICSVLGSAAKPKNERFFREQPESQPVGGEPA